MYSSTKIYLKYHIKSVQESCFKLQWPNPFLICNFETILKSWKMKIILYICKISPSCKIHKRILSLILGFKKYLVEINQGPKPPL